MGRFFRLFCQKGGGSEAVGMGRGEKQRETEKGRNKWSCRSPILSTYYLGGKFECFKGIMIC